jgi:hypothetical protein
MNEADPTASLGELRTVDVSSQLFLSSKRARGEQLQLIHQGAGGLYVGGGIFAPPKQNRHGNNDSETESDTKGAEQIIGESPWSAEYEDQQMSAAMAERRRKGKERVAECSHPKGRLSKSIIVENPTANAPTVGAPQQKETYAKDPFMLSDDDDPVLDPEHDKFNLANQLPREEFLQALEDQNVIGDSSARTREE